MAPWTSWEEVVVTEVMEGSGNWLRSSAAVGGRGSTKSAEGVRIARTGKRVEERAVHAERGGLSRGTRGWTTFKNAWRLDAEGACDGLAGEVGLDGELDEAAESLVGRAMHQRASNVDQAVRDGRRVGNFGFPKLDEGRALHVEQPLALAQGPQRALDDVALYKGQCATDGVMTFRLRIRQVR